MIAAAAAGAIGTACCCCCCSCSTPFCSVADHPGRDLLHETSRRRRVVHDLRSATADGVQNSQIATVVGEVAHAMLARS